MLPLRSVFCLSEFTPVRGPNDGDSRHVSTKDLVNLWIELRRDLTHQSMRAWVIEVRHMLIGECQFSAIENRNGNRIGQTEHGTVVVSHFRMHQTTACPVVRLDDDRLNVF